MPAKCLLLQGRETQKLLPATRPLALKWFLWAGFACRGAAATQCLELLVAALRWGTNPLETATTRDPHLCSKIHQRDCTTCGTAVSTQGPQQLKGSLAAASTMTGTRKAEPSAALRSGSLSPEQLLQLH